MSFLAMVQKASLVKLLGDTDVPKGERRFEVATHYWGRAMTVPEIAALMGISDNVVSGDIGVIRRKIPSLRSLPGGRKSER